MQTRNQGKNGETANRRRKHLNINSGNNKNRRQFPVHLEPRLQVWPPGSAVSVNGCRLKSNNFPPSSPSSQVEDLLSSFCVRGLSFVLALSLDWTDSVRVFVRKENSLSEQ